MTDSQPRPPARPSSSNSMIQAGSAAVVALVAAGAGWLALTQDSPSSGPDPSSSSPAVPDRSVAEGKTFTGTLKLTTGDVGVELDGTGAPQGVAVFATLAQRGFFDGTPCHRVTAGGLFVLQCGDPTGTGTGGPGFTWGPVENAPEDGTYPEGTIAVARARDDGSSQGSQFFIVYKESRIPQDQAGGYTVIGKVTSGLDSIKDLARESAQAGVSDGRPAKAVNVESFTLGER